ncbi:hypothetical protein AWE51_00460 [Aquimarina aggregata]|uniref:N-acetyltransferase domain-containing protein n=1 Tax=Aquimarina aggregata TaxID=1642818 RepID=A0A162CW43_9FLAO|nr:GNAT family N-acetyltransferase [Aquimarina aggregata]KZS41949.1 hypothetical protein AWE51_00460 [Aquimarina aggregata]
MKLKKAVLQDILTLQKVCKESYTQVFADHWTENGLTLYLKREFGDKRLSAELIDSSIAYYFIIVENENIGFLKINYKSSYKLSELNNCELEKIYVLPKFSGKGIGKKVMIELIGLIKKKQKKVLFLCVIDTNINAISFYKKIGFKFHSKTRLEIAHFKDELRGMHRMSLKLT